MRKTLLVFAAMLMPACVAFSAAQAQEPAKPKPPSCTDASHRQFDFWLGEWEVRDPAGKRLGHNRIESAHGGCALVENWRGEGGVTGTSINIYDRDHGRWHQTWVDSGGGLLQLDGGIVRSAMVLEGDAVDADAPRKIARQRVSWTPQPDGGVRQLWEASSDGGATWNVIFDGRYTRKR